MNVETSDVLDRALQKQAEGRGTTNTEKRAISDFRRGRIGQDHFTRIQVAPLKVTKPQPSIRAAEIGTQIGTGRDSLQFTSADSNSALSARIATLEALLAGMSRQSFAVCIAGVPSTKTLPAA